MAHMEQWYSMCIEYDCVPVQFIHIYSMDTHVIDCRHADGNFILKI